MSLSFYWTLDALHCVSHGEVYLLTAEDPRYVWVLAALSENESLVDRVLQGELPVIASSDTWPIEYQEDDETWSLIEVGHDLTQSCLVACAYFHDDTTVQRVRVLNDSGTMVYQLHRSLIGK